MIIIPSYLEEGIAEAKVVPIEEYIEITADESA